MAFEPSRDGLLFERVIPLTEGPAIPHSRITDANGDIVNFRELKDQVSVVTFWATWCHECETEMPRLNALAREVEGRGIHIRPVSVDRSETPDARLASYMKRKDLDALPILRDLRMELFQQVGAQGTPTTIIIDKYAQVVGAVLGGRFDWSDKEIIGWLDALAQAPDAETSRMILAPLRP
jgi:thiol-disulfide isomerase/thioredoxin